MRHAVQRGYEALYTLQELNHLLLSPLVAGNPMVVEEVQNTPSIHPFMTIHQYTFATKIRSENTL